MKLSLPWILFGLLFVIGCSEPSDENTDIGGETASDCAEVEAADKTEDDNRIIAPLELGKQERFILHIAQHGMAARSYEVSYEVTGTKEIEGKTYFVNEVDMGGCPEIPDHKEYERDAEDGRYMVIDKDGEMSEEFMVIPYPVPVEIGSEWVVDPPHEEAGKFWVAGYETQDLLGHIHEDCLKISFTREHCKGHIWQKPGVGAVKCVFDYGHTVLVYLKKTKEAKESKEEMEPES